MTTTYLLRGTPSDLAGGADFSAALTQDAPGIGNSYIVSVAASATEDSYGFTPVNDPSTLGITGVYSVVVGIQAGNTNIQVSIALSRINAAGVAQQASAFSLEQTATVGTKTFNFPSTNLGTWSSGDRLRVTYRFRSTSNMVQSTQVGHTDGSSTVTAPWNPPPFGGDDALFTDVCGNDLAQINKWTQVGAGLGSTQLNLVDETNINTTNYGICKIRKSFINPTKLYYAYTPFLQGPPLVITYPVHIGWIDTETMVKTELVVLQRRLEPAVHYWMDYFDVDRADNLYYMSSFTSPADGVAGYQTNYIPNGPADPVNRRLTKMDSTGAILNDVCATDPYVQPDQVAGVWPSPCVVLPLSGSKWVALDGQAIYGFSAHLSGGTSGCSSVADSNMTYRIDVSSGTVTWPIATVGTQVESANSVNSSIMSNFSVVYYPDGSIAIPGQVIKNAGGSYVNLYRFTNNGVFLEYFHMTGLNADINAIPGTIVGFHADVNTAGTTLFCRLNYNASVASGTDGRAKIYSTPYPFAAGSVFTFKFDAYALTTSTCHWGEIAVNTGARDIVSGLYVNIQDVATVIANLTTEPPLHKRPPFVTLIGAN